MITNIAKNIKGRGAGVDKMEVFTLIVLVMTGIISFGLGRLSVDKQKTEEKDQNVYVYGYSYSENLDGEVLGQNTSVSRPTNGPSNYVASINGQKYYSVGCSGANSIKEDNKIFFETQESAEDAS